jgi:regulator of sigma D
MGKREGPHLLQPKKAVSSLQPHIDLIIQQWLKHRQELLIQYSQVCASHHSDLEKLEVFCQTLMDYLSSGHFKVFEKLAEYYQTQHPHSSGLDTNALKNISKTTDIALDFNDKYTNPKSLETLSEDVSYLGVNLANRMDWEDILIKNYLQFSSE